MRMKSPCIVRHRATLLIMVLTVSSCANFASINRHTNIPDHGKKNSRAIHLDAQQRLVIFSAKRYCAEPSPDALAAYATAIGLSLSNLPDEAIAGTVSNANSVVGIGLRTQSITLMRDTLYRMCEASANNDLSELQVAMLLNRSQDLSMVILAIEQVTGAIAVNPSSVSGSSSASSSTALLANAQALETAKRIEEEASKAKEDAAADLEKKSGELAGLKTRLEDKKKETPATPEEAQLLKTAIAELEVAVKQAEEKEARAKNVLAEKEAAHKNAKETLQAIELQRDSAILLANSNASAQANPGTISRESRIDAQTAKVVADGVQNMVNAMLGKTYDRDNCFLFLTQGEASAARSLGQIYDYEVDKRAKAENVVLTDNASSINWRRNITNDPEILKPKSDDPFYIQQARATYEAQREIRDICKKILLN